MTSRRDLLVIAREIAGSARGSEQIEARVGRGRDTDVEVLRGSVESLTVAESEGVTIRVVIDGRQGVASAGSLDPEIVAATLEDARDNARFAEPDEFSGLATPGELGNAVAPDLNLWRDDLALIPTEEKVAIALELERAVLSANSLVRGVESSSYGDGANESALVTSTGIEASHRRTTASLGASALAGPESETQTGYGFSVGRTLSDLDLEYAANQAANRAVRLLGATQPKTQHIPVILDPLVSRTILALIISALGAESVQKGRSMFAGRLGEEIGSPIVNLIEDPTNPEAFGATPFDSEGAPTRRVDLVTAGVLNGYLHNVTTARRGKTVTTGSALGSGVGARAAYLRPGPLSIEELFASVPHALYVQSVSGIHSGTSTVSGDFSVGAEGLMVRDGVFAEPVREATIASTLPRILLDIAQIGSDLTWLPGGGAGMTLLISDMMLSGS